MARGVTKLDPSQRSLERATKEGDRPVGKRGRASLVCDLEYHGTRGILWEPGETTLQG